MNKVLGFFREIILAFFFGSSLIYSSYLLLKTLTDFLSKFTFGNALQANILPKFTRLYEKNEILNLKFVYIFSKKISISLFFLSLILQLFVIFFLIGEFYFLLIFTAVILSFILSLNFHNSLFLNILQAKGDFKKFSIAELSNGFVSTFFIYPLSLIFNIVGVVFSRLFGVFTVAYFYINPILKSNNGHNANVSMKDFNFSVVFLSNLYLFIFLVARFISGLNSSSDIAFFNYSFLLLNIFMTALIFNINSIVLRQISLRRDLKYFYYAIYISIFSSLILYFIVQNYSLEIVSTVFMRGAFNISDATSTAFFLRKLTLPFILSVFSTIFLQPFFSLGIKKISKQCLNYSYFLLIVVIFILMYCLIFKISSQSACFLFVYSMSFSSILVSILSLKFFLDHEI